MPDGVVLIGDALQNACPSTGLGFKKVFTDVSVLAKCVPAWLSTPGMSAVKLRTFYDHPRKRSMDSLALRRAHQHRNAASSQSLRWRLRRALVHLKWDLERLKNHSLRLPTPDIAGTVEVGRNAPAGATPVLEEVAYGKK